MIMMINYDEGQFSAAVSVGGAGRALHVGRPRGEDGGAGGGLGAAHGGPRAHGADSPTALSHDAHCPGGLSQASCLGYFRRGEGGK